MNKLISLLVLLMIATSLIAQDDTYYFDDFDDNTNLWKEFSDDDASAKIQNGFFVIHNKKLNSIYRFWRDVYIQETSDFSIKVRMKQISGPENYGYGIIWNSYGWKNSYNFEISSNGYFRIYYYNEGTKTDIQAWTKTEHINALGVYNILKIDKTEDSLKFYINENEVYTCAYYEAFGSNLGFVLGQNIMSMVDYMEIKEEAQEIKLVENAISDNEKENMGLSINSIYSEIAPIISPDGKTLYVARASHYSNYGTDKSKYDIWYSELGDDGNWSTLKNIGTPLNNAGDNLVIAVTADNNTIMVEGLYTSTGTYISDKGISISTKLENGKWSIPQEVIIDNYYNYNEYESFCPTTDRTVLVMSVERDDSKGIKDLYVSFLQDDGTYSEPKNMGSVINTYANDGTPFIASDGKTLYYYTYGKAGYGSADIFVTKRLDDTWTNWSEPLNLGTMVNSSAWDTYFSISASSDYAYLVSTKDTYGDGDIYKIKLDNEELLPEAVVLVKGIVYDKSTNKPLKATITYKNIDTDEITATATSNPTTGAYTIILEIGKKFEYYAEKTGYFPATETIDLSAYTEYAEIEKDLYLSPLEIGETVVLNNILFKAGSDDFLEESYSELKKLLLMMKTNTNIKIEIYGHTENRGDKTQLLELSKTRAEAVKQYLVDNGISEERITDVIGYGDSKPLESNDTEAGRKKNRRVEFKITEN